MSTEASSTAPLPQALGELRIALAMSGGIALTLYESGVSHEVYRFFKAGQVVFRGAAGTATGPDARTQSPVAGYDEALRETKLEPVIDILTGASAGGINSIFLASCVASGRDFGAFHDIWIDTADIGRLQYGGVENLRSILNTEPLHAAMLKQLTINAGLAEAAAKKSGASLPELIVRLCRTECKSRCLSAIDAVGHKIDVESRTNVIGFGTNDFRQLDKISELSAAALATSAFPVLFPPVLDTKANRWYVDGGLWDNQPIDLAVAAIRDKPAVSRTHRCLMFVEPNPSFYPDASGQAKSKFTIPSAPNKAEPEVAASRSAPPSPPNALDVLAGLPFMGVKGNIWPALESILDFNQRQSLYDSLTTSPNIGSILWQLGLSEYQTAFTQLETSVHWPGPLTGQETVAEARLLIDELENKPGKPLTALNAARFGDILLGSDSRLHQMWSAVLEGATDVSPAHAALLWAWAAKTLWLFAQRDLARLLVRHKLADVNRQIDGNQSSTQLEAQGKVTRATPVAPVSAEQSVQKAAFYAKLDELGQTLDKSEFRQLTEDWLLTLHKCLKAEKDSEKLFQDLFGLGQQWFQLIKAEVALAPRKADSLARLQGLLNTGQLGAQTDEEQLQKSFKELETQIDSFFDSLKETKPNSSHGLVAMYLLGDLSDLVGKRSIDLIRISPNDTTNESLAWPDVTDEEKATSTAAQRKLAGERLGHLTGFLETRWRRNDYIWGRLDAAEIILRAVQRYGEQQGCPLSPQAFDQCLASAQNAILNQEALLLPKEPAGMPEPPDPNWKSQCGSTTRTDVEPSKIVKANAYLIGYGREDLQDATEPGLTKNVDYLVNAGIRLARGSSDKVPMQLSVAGRLSRLLSYLVTLITWFVPIKVHRDRTGDVWKCIILFLLAIGAAGAIGFFSGKGILVSDFFSYFSLGLGSVLFLICGGALLGGRFWPVIWLGLFAAGALCGWHLHDTRKHQEPPPIRREVARSQFLIPPLSPQE